MCFTSLKESLFTAENEALNVVLEKQKGTWSENCDHKQQRSEKCEHKLNKHINTCKKENTCTSMCCISQHANVDCMKINSYSNNV